MNNNNTPDGCKQTAIFLLTVLQAVINEQVKTRQLKREVGDYLYNAVMDQAIRQGWIE